jgi:hypothetical protein
MYDKHGATMFLLVHVDDIMIMSSSPTAIDPLLKDLRPELALKDLGSLHYFLGIQVMKKGNGLVLSQEKYASGLLDKVGMENYRPVATPLSTSEKMSIEVGTQLGEKDSTRYQSVVGTL